MTTATDRPAPSPCPPQLAPGPQESEEPGASLLTAHRPDLPIGGDLDRDGADFVPGTVDRLACNTAKPHTSTLSSPAPGTGPPADARESA
ncbi:protein of unknown function [Blastococcus saxobsidens DD2]|uniref:Uncharacterized protein n=1 Tax=Blastococcus saxobsidens (strain DD2) TaxID=1146883 RepID=H6RQZ0_BLASD|nr:protein of unknown function [Blastococcus saxobsidens DD2]